MPTVSDTGLGSPVVPEVKSSPSSLPRQTWDGPGPPAPAPSSSSSANAATRAGASGVLECSSGWLGSTIRAGRATSSWRWRSGAGARPERGTREAPARRHPCSSEATSERARPMAATRSPALTPSWSIPAATRVALASSSDQLKVRPLSESASASPAGSSSDALPSGSRTRPRPCLNLVVVVVISPRMLT